MFNVVKNTIRYRFNTGKKMLIYPWNYFKTVVKGEKNHYDDLGLTVSYVYHINIVSSMFTCGLEKSAPMFTQNTCHYHMIGVASLVYAIACSVVNSHNVYR